VSNASKPLTCTVTSLVLFVVTTLQAQDYRPVTHAPVPIQIGTAKKVFISNIGSDALATPDFRRLGQPDLPYQRFYSEMKGWGRYELVASPAEADLVFEIHFGDTLSDCGKVTSYLPQFEISIFDARTHFVLWTLAASVQGAIRQATFERNLDRGMASLMADLKAIAAPTGSPVAVSER